MESALSHNFNLTYFSFNMFNYTNVFANVSYNKNIDRIRNFSEPGIIRINSPLNSNFADESVNANGRFQRTFGKLRATASGNFSYSKFNNFIGTTQSANENYTQSYRAQFRTNFRKAPNVELSYRHTIQDTDLGNARSKAYTKSPSIDFDALIWKVLTFRTDYTYTNFSNDLGTENTYDFLNASLAYRKDKDSQWELELKASNLLDTKSQINTSQSDFSVNTSEYYIQPRFVTFRVIYNL